MSGAKSRLYLIVLIANFKHAAQGALTLTLLARGKQNLLRFSKLDGDVLEKTYIEDSIANNRYLIETINRTLLESMDPEVRKLLIVTRDHANVQLQKALELQQDYNKA